MSVTVKAASETCIRLLELALSIEALVELSPELFHVWVTTQGHTPSSSSKMMTDTTPPVLMTHFVAVYEVALPSLHHTLVSNTSFNDSSRTLFKRIRAAFLATFHRWGTYLRQHGQEITLATLLLTMVQTSLQKRQEHPSRLSSDRTSFFHDLHRRFNLKTWGDAGSDTSTQLLTLVTDPLPCLARETPTRAVACSVKCRAHVSMVQSILPDVSEAFIVSSLTSYQNDPALLIDALLTGELDPLASVVSLSYEEEDADATSSLLGLPQHNIWIGKKEAGSSLMRVAYDPSSFDDPAFGAIQRQVLRDYDEGEGEDATMTIVDGLHDEYDDDFQDEFEHVVAVTIPTAGDFDEIRAQNRKALAQEAEVDFWDSIRNPNVTPVACDDDKAKKEGATVSKIPPTQTPSIPSGVGTLKAKAKKAKNKARVGNHNRKAGAAAKARS